MALNRNAAIGFIFVTILIDVIGFGIIIPVMPDLISQLKHVETNTAATYGSWLMSAYALTQFIFAPIIGGLSDRYGRRKILLLSLFGFAIDYIFMALASSLPVLFIGHGSPMNALQDNPFTRHLNRLGQTLARPVAILVVSAHWLTPGRTLVGVQALVGPEWLIEIEVTAVIGG